MEKDYIRLPDCKKGYLYSIRSRNLSVGVYDGKEGFIGIRTKFDSRYLFTEYHWDQGPPYGTVHPIKELGPLPEHLVVAEDLGTIDSKSQRPIEWVEGKKSWVFKDTQEVFSPIVGGGIASSVFNRPLFEFLNKFEEA